jgi:hypothetical protein
VLEDHLPRLLGSVDNRLDSGCIESIVSRVYHKQSLSEASRWLTLNIGKLAGRAKRPVLAGKRSMVSVIKTASSSVADKTNESLDQIIVWRPKTSRAMARTRLSTSPKGGRCGHKGTESATEGLLERILQRVSRRTQKAGMRPPFMSAKTEARWEVTMSARPVKVVRKLTGATHPASSNRARRRAPRCSGCSSSRSSTSERQRSFRDSHGLAWRCPVCVRAGGKRLSVSRAHSMCVKLSMIRRTVFLTTFAPM